MCGRYYVDDETSQEIEKIVKKLDQRLKIEPKSFISRTCDTISQMPMKTRIPVKMLIEPESFISR